uniref:15-hydroxyprostaglandin dehydrogenase [NAD(+)] n=1 Tax=Timema bartmani TaxID=61472 RepID=A0A7R9F9K7_9NEOP|nr:unnamed protein product [Timema bartmani]
MFCRRSMAGLWRTASGLTKKGKYPLIGSNRALWLSSTLRKKGRPNRQSQCRGGKREEIMDPNCKVSRPWGAGPGGQQLGTKSPTSQKPPEIPWGRVSKGSSECLQVAIVTGGATGIGYSAAYKLLKHGAKCVVISSRRKEKGVEAAEKLNGRFGKDRALFIQGDVNDEKHFRCLFEEPIRRYGQVDVLFNNAGMLEDKNWQLAVDTNLTSLIRGNFLAFEYMGKNNNHHGGIVVNNASIVGLQTLHGAPVQTGIRVVALCPGVTETVLVTDARGKQYNPDWGKEAERLLSSLPTQSTSVTGLAFVDLIRYAPSGTIWVIENSQLLRADLPDRHSYSTVAAKYK